MIAALFIEREGRYWPTLWERDIDPWDEERDARKYSSLGAAIIRTRLTIGRE